MARISGAGHWPRATCLAVTLTLALLAVDLLYTAYVLSRPDLAVAGLIFALLVVYSVTITVILQRHWAARRTSRSTARNAEGREKVLPEPRHTGSLDFPK